MMSAAAYRRSMSRLVQQPFNLANETRRAMVQAMEQARSSRLGVGLPLIDETARFYVRVWLQQAANFRRESAALGFRLPG